ncbi:unnamed protein product [Phytomonas sp. Hart1]|nr:unnamed protein product [Phytomonas sp. Hart1]|eukprot:CCW66848.1 unnamed protein product [Phytomonas sp. isolate Hart1]
MDVPCSEELEEDEFPRPMMTSLECAVSPIHHLLLSYPIPELIVPTRITSFQKSADIHHQDDTLDNKKHSEAELQSVPTFSREAAEPGQSGSNEYRWELTEVQNMAQNMQTCITDLLRSGQCTRFLQEEFHSESCAAASSTSMPATASTPKQCDESTDIIPTASAVSYLEKQVTESLMIQLRSATSRATTISRPSSLKDTPSGNWTSGSHMIPQPHKTSMPSQQQQQTSPEVEPLVRNYTITDSLTKKQSASPIVEVNIASKDILTEMLENMNTLSEDVTGFLSFAYTPSLGPDSFKEVPMDKLSSLVSALVADDKAEEGGRNPSSYQKDWLRTARAMCCITLVSYTVFDVKLIPDGTIERLITIFASVVRYVTAELYRPTPEKNVHESKVARGRWTKCNTAEANMLPISQDMPNELSVCCRQHFIPPKTMLKWIEALRLFLQRLAPVVCNRTLDLVPDTELIRLEDLVYHVLFVAPHRSVTRDVYLWYTNYITDCALHTYRCLWNRLESQRTVTAKRFFSRMLLSNYLTLRTLVCLDGNKLLPLTVAILSAAQSVPIDTNASGSHLTVCLQSQCDLWADCLLNQLIFEHEKDEKPLQTITWSILTLFLEDLVKLIGAPDWPAADMLLRSCVLSLIKAFFGNTIRRKSTKSNKLASSNITVHTTAAIDVIAEVTLKLFHPTITDLSSVLQSQKLQGAETLNGMMNKTLLEYWANAMQQCTTKGKSVKTHENSGPSRHQRGAVNSKTRKTYELDTKECDTASTSGQNSEHLVSKDENLVISITNQIRRLIYYALSHYVETTSEADEASLWFHARAVHVLGWHLNNTTPLPTSALDQLIQAKAVPCAGVRVDLAELHHWGRTLRAHEDESMLNVNSRLMLVSLLLNVLHVKDDHGQETLIASDAVAKKSLHHLSRIAEMCPSVSRLLWPVARRCARENCVYMRELSVSLLLTMVRSVLTASAGVSTLSMEENNLTTDAVSLLLRLLEDKSVTVVSRAIVALETLVTNRLYASLLDSTPGKELFGFIQYRLLLKVKNPKHTTEIIRLFCKRWVLEFSANEDMVSTAMGMMHHIRLTSELLALVLRSAPEYPFEVQDDHPLIHLLHGLRQLEATAPLLETAEITGIVRELQKSSGGDIQHIMRNVARSLWNRQQTATTAKESVLCMATLRVLAVVANEWIDPLIDIIVSGLEDPLTSTPLSLKDQLSKRGNEWLGGVLLQTCHIIKAVLSSPKVPTISLEDLARSLTKLLSKYTGPYQQRIIASSCGALSSMITCGAKHKLSSYINQNYLRVCYSLMNLYYMRVKGLLPELMNQLQNIAYIQRFLFLLSELLRSYPGWRTPHPVLYQDAAASSGSTVPNMLVKGGGICENIYKLVVEVRTQCDKDTRSRLNVITLRVLASLCMLQPIEFLHRCEAYLMEALTDPTDVTHQTQGLSFILDFLADEDARVDCASRLGSKMSPDASVLFDQDSEKSDREGGAHVKSRGRHPPRGIKRTRVAMASAQDALSLPEQSSGMATWVIQQFHSHIIERCKTQHVTIRKLCLDILQLTSQGRLLPPVKYLHAVIALAADVDPGLRQSSVQFLLTYHDQHEDIASLASRGIELTYDIHHLCGVNLIQSAATFSDGAAVGQSIHAPLFTLMHKPSRDGVIVSLLRYFYNESKAEAWVSGNDNKVSGRPIEDMFCVSNPITFLGHLAVVIATLPFSSESDILHLAQRCRTGIDLHGESALDQVSSLLTTYRETKSGSAQVGDIKQPLMDIVSLWKCVGMVLLVYIYRAVCTEHRLKSFKLHNSALRGNLLHTSLYQQDHKNNKVGVFHLSVKTLTRHASTLLPLCSGLNIVHEHGKVVNGKEQRKSASALLVVSSKEAEEALVFLCQELESGILEEGIGGVERGCSTTLSAGACQRYTKKRIRVTTGRHKRYVPRQKENLSTQDDTFSSSHSTHSSSSVSEGDDDTTEEDSETTASSVSMSAVKECDAD